MTRYHFDLARPDDDAELRALLHRIEMPGPVRLKLLREPGFFAGTDLGPDDLLVARDRSGRMVGTLGLRDQRSLRQSVVSGYQRPLQLLRPAHNLVAQIRRGVPLPPPGSRLDHAVAALPLTAPDRAAVLDALLTRAQHLAHARRIPFFLFGLHQDDHRHQVARRRASHRYHTTVHLVAWDEPPAAVLDDRRVPYLELGLL